jgi:hypothetical protein
MSHLIRGAAIGLVSATMLIGNAAAQQYGDPNDTLICRQAREVVDVDPRTAAIVGPEAAEKLRQKRLARLEEAKARCEEIKNEYARKNEELRRQREAERAIRDAEMREETERFRRRQEAEAAEAAARAEWLRKPANRLALAYAQYMYVRACHAARQGYLAVWINDVQMQRARDAVTRIENEVLKEDGTIDTTATWKEIDQRSPSHIFEYRCKPAYEELISAAPGLPTVKDFGNR